jgi:hypothetical protein
MKYGHATVVSSEPIGNDRTRLSFLYGAVQCADNALTVDVLGDDEWGGW